MGWAARGLLVIRPTPCRHRPPCLDVSCRRSLYEKRLAAEVDGDDIGEEFKGYVLKITGGQDKQGFSMHQGVLTADRVRLMPQLRIDGMVLRERCGWGWTGAGRE